MWTVYVSMTMEVHRGVRFLGAGVMGTVDHRLRCWELNSGNLEEQGMLLTLGPSL